ncbi:DUF502 domain-containing protein [Xanthobacteraceae bacterium Astr-EGSB]|uniref:DUF502 domain-containing protein n=1 Tax=Astrobacterium formosum TaxID=3069710 RepID=UPI0027ADEB6E|nr:DUF502 domain-containing protein [Xanthobacteraceae bacterium Astr-EGSB]
MKSRQAGAKVERKGVKARSYGRQSRQFDVCPDEAFWQARHGRVFAAKSTLRRRAERGDSKRIAVLNNRFYMRSILRRVWRTSIIGNLVAGSLVILPLVLTVLIIGWAINWIVAVAGPGTWFGDILTFGGAALIGPQREGLTFLIGVVLMLFILWLLGLAVRAQAQRTAAHVIDDLFAKVPLFRTVYRPISQVVRLFARSNADLAGLPVVMCRLGGAEGVDVPAFLASSQTYEVNGEPRLLVYLPTSPLPAWGGLVLVPKSAVVPVPDMDADALIKLYFSFGVLGPETIPAATPRRDAAPALPNKAGSEPEAPVCGAREGDAPGLKRV